MNVEALWSVEFHSNLEMFGNGIVVFETGRVFGGDSMMIYVGDYRSEGGTVQAEIKVSKYADAGPMVSVMGLESFTLVVTGPLDVQKMHLSGYVKEAPERKMSITAIRRAELP